MTNSRFYFGPIQATPRVITKLNNPISVPYAAHNLGRGDHLGVNVPISLPSAGSGLNNYSVPATKAVGPIGNTSTNTSPWERLGLNSYTR